MAFNGSGTYSLYATGNPVIAGTTISSTWANNTLNDIATGLTTCITKNGQTTTTAVIPFAEGVSVPTGKSVTGAGTASIAGFKTVAAATGMAVGGATPGAGGLAFPATAVAVSDVNTLDDYEEGSWTPADVSGASLAITGSGTYTKIGRLVIAPFSITYPTTTSNLQSFISVPFSTTFGGGAVIITYTNYDSPFIGYTEGTNNRMSFVTYAGVSLPNANLSEKRIDGVIVYFVA